VLNGGGADLIRWFLIAVVKAQSARRLTREGTMPTILPRKRYHTALLLMALAGFAGAASAEDVPSYMAPIGGRTTSSAAETATKDLLALNTMFPQESDG
jgi:hypothetical protein